MSVRSERLLCVLRPGVEPNQITFGYMFESNLSLRKFVYRPEETTSCRLHWYDSFINSEGFVWLSISLCIFFEILEKWDQKNHEIQQLNTAFVLK